MPANPQSLPEATSELSQTETLPAPLFEAIRKGLLAEVDSADELRVVSWAANLSLELLAVIRWLTGFLPSLPAEAPVLQVLVKVINDFANGDHSPLVRDKVESELSAMKAVVREEAERELKILQQRTSEPNSCHKTGNGLALALKAKYGLAVFLLAPAVILHEVQREGNKALEKVRPKFAEFGCKTQIGEVCENSAHIAILAFASNYCKKVFVTGGFDSVLSQDASSLDPDKVVAAWEWVARNTTLPDHPVLESLRADLEKELVRVVPPTPRQDGEEMRSIQPALLSATDLAKYLGQSGPAVESFLRRYRDNYPDCCTVVEGPRRNEPRYLYRTEDVLPHLQKHFGVPSPK